MENAMTRISKSIAAAPRTQRSRRGSAAGAAAAALTLGALTFGLAGTASAVRIVAQPEADYELSLADVQALPQSTAGYIVFKACPNCDTTSVTVSADTIYLVGQAPVALAQFLETAQTYRQEEAGAAYLFIFYDIASKHVNRVIVSRPAS
jgi:hypothetical protein